MAVTFTADELTILRPRKAIPLLAWAERYRYLDARIAAEPGPWRADRVPYMRGPHEAFSDAAVEQITFLSSTQVGKTTFIENVLAYTFDQRPRPTLMVMARQDDALDFSKDRLQPLFSCCPVLRGRTLGGKGNLASDITKRVYRLPNMIFRLASAESPAALSSWPCGVVCMDEVSKYRIGTHGKGTDPVELARERTRTFPDRKIIITSTPEADADLIMIEFERSDAHYYHVPCPHCGAYQVLEWEQLKYTADPDARKRLMKERKGAAELAWYECAHCQARIDDIHKPEMLRRGVWARRTLLADGTYRDAPIPAGLGKARPGTGLALEPWTRHVGFFIWAAYSPWLTFAEIAAQYLESKGDREKYKIFVTLWLARPWQEKGESVAASVVTSCIDADTQRGTVPEAAVVLTAMFDLHDRHIPFVVRGWSADVSSWLVWHGVLPRPGGRGSPLDEIVEPIRTTLFGGRAIALLGIDARWDTEQVYIYVSKHPRQCAAVMGAKPATAPSIKPFPIERLPDGKPYRRGGITYQINPGYWSQVLFDHMATPRGAPGEWRCYGDVANDSVYLDEVANQQGLRRIVGGREVITWGPKDGKKGDHYHDCEKGAMALARSERVALLRRTVRAPAAPAAQPRPGGPWLDGKRGNWLGK
jgi:phage terminase large subunit GpA-like protein